MRYHWEDLKRCIRKYIMEELGSEFDGIDYIKEVKLDSENGKVELLSLTREGRSLTMKVEIPEEMRPVMNSIQPFGLRRY